ncbi:hypothetical protein F4803DRAFT_570475 [Xylaria telfairii]|nr:hypothetical protein F4803DRAFT_570475 [Xylaria telfairii]
MPPHPNHGPYRPSRQCSPRWSPIPPSERRVERPPTPSTPPVREEATPSSQANTSSQTSPSNQVFPIASLGELGKEGLKRQRDQVRRNQICHRRPLGPPVSIPLMDVIISRWQCEIYFELPGISREHIDLLWSSDENKITVSAYLDRPYVYSGDRYIIRERSTLLERSIVLDEILMDTPMEEAIVEAHEVGVRTLMRDGLLVICIIKMSPTALAIAGRENMIKNRLICLDMPEIPLNWVIDGVKYVASTRVVLQRTGPRFGHDID